MAERTSMSVTIQGRAYRVRTGRDPRRVQRAAKLVDETLTRLRARTKRQDSLEAAILAALNLAENLETKSRSPARAAAEGVADFDARCEALATHIEQALQRSEPSP